MCFWDITLAPQSVFSLTVLSSSSWDNPTFEIRCSIFDIRFFHPVPPYTPSATTIYRRGCIVTGRSARVLPEEATRRNGPLSWFEPCFEDQKEDQTMADCGDMKKGDVFFCKNCGLELEVTKSCSCGTGGQSGSCTVPLQCCGGEMQKKR